ncbi:class II aldolase/adducin family protein [Acinetobacter bereziniae]|uniref:class II aldolase and adducin N-terminal domain-containing protein n=1 Tax=Acinetobacter TaxID=469 RepID=UPI00157FE27A|nr:class II aldolase and adducin N-terminal domain-containing protein [Acinetobacter bereziniae]NUF65140.1 class II aldolase/adducin family protein [Acinetobacter bereziniae]NUG09119.1 class II aldolase/adducin family protein [Acinetobacter bereziniae]NUG65839.1 class II aldolase/adducin family protein [Acinetobacter bereziniae]NUG81941.1 class II aldolase/adducin family protein [Acinetobacter bereziniae]
MKSESQIRIDLAASLRLSAKLGMHEAVANHFSAAVSEDGKSFLLNPKWVHFSKVKASDLILVHADDPDSFEKGKIDSTAWAIHGQIHQLRPDIKVIMHLHPVYATALSCLKNPTLLPIEQNSARYFNRVSYDSNYSGMADQLAEGQRLAGLLKDNSRLLMGNHGVLIGSHDIGVAFDDIYTFERASQILIHAYSTGQTLNILNDQVAEKTAQDWEKIEDFSIAHFEQMKSILIEEDPSVLD